MKQKIVILSLILLISAFMVACTSHSPDDIGLVTENKSDEDAIKEVITEYLKAIKNYNWESYDKNDGLEFWTDQGKDEWLTNPSKLPNLEKSIKENKISRKLEENEISEIKVNGDTATAEAFTIEEGTSNNIRFSGTVQSYETITLTKTNNTWRISDRSARVLVIP